MGPCKKADSRTNWKRATESCTFHQQRQRLGLIPLADRRKNHRITLQLLLRILQDEQHHHVLSSSYDEILKSRADANMTTRAASRGELTSIWAKSKLYYDSFLPQTIRDLRVTKN